MHAMIRKKCCSLLNELYINHFIPNSMCNCKVGNENAAHLFFHCFRPVYDFVSSDKMIVCYFSSPKSHVKKNSEIFH